MATNSRVYRANSLTAEKVNFINIKDISDDHHALFWFDLLNPTREEIDQLGDAIGFDSFHLDDAFDGRQRPKLDVLSDYLFINTYTANFDAVTQKLSTSEIAIFVTKNGLITVRTDAETEIAHIQRRWDETAKGRNISIDFLLWGVLDVIVDGYFDALDYLDDGIEDLEEVMLSEKSTSRPDQRTTYDLRKSLVLLRRTTLPMREIVGPLIRQDVIPISPEMALHYHDVYDHVIRVADWTESLRDLISTLIETNLTIQSNRMNLVMKKVTSWAAIIAVPTAITGFYGQTIPYPGFGAESGFWVSTAAIVVISSGLYLAFKRRDWL